MKSIFLLVLGGSLLIFCLARIEHQEKRCFECARVTPVSSFDLEQFSSKWNMIVKSSPLIKLKQKCNSFNISAINATKANIAYYHQNIWTNRARSGNTHLSQKYDNIQGILAIGPPHSKFTSRTNYTIIDVDYKNYVVVHVCTRFLFLEFESAYILSPNLTLNKSTVDKGKQKLKNFGFEIDHFTAVDQLNC